MLNVPDPSGPVVYALYNDDDDIIYVGYSGNFKQRMDDHRSRQPWWPEATRVQCFDFDTVEQARAKEAEVIARVDPVYNVRGRTAPVEVGYAQARDRSRKATSSWR